MTQKKYDYEIVALYLKDKEEFLSLRSKLRTLYFKKYRSNLTMANSMMVALTLACNALESEASIFVEQKSVVSLDRKYGRLE